MTTASETTDDGDVVIELDLGPYWDKVYALEDTAAELRASLIRMGGTDPGKSEELETASL